jgi:hypothetical protein
VQHKAKIVPHIQLHLKFPKNKKTNKKGGFLVDSRMQIFSVNDIDLFTEATASSSYEEIGGELGPVRSFLKIN